MTSNKEKIKKELMSDLSSKTMSHEMVTEVLSDDLQMSEYLNKMVDFLASAEDFMPKMSEEVFKRDFLPLFLIKEEAEVDMRPWLTAVNIASMKTRKIANPKHMGAVYDAGAAFQHVKIVKNLNKEDEEVLFIIPPLINSKGLTVTDYDTRESFGEVMDNIVSRISNARVRAKEIIEDGLSKAAMGEVVYLDEDQKELLKMYNYYNIDIKSHFNLTKSVKSNVKTPSSFLSADNSNDTTEDL